MLALHSKPRHRSGRRRRRRFRRGINSTTLIGVIVNIAYPRRLPSKVQWPAFHRRRRAGRYDFLLGRILRRRRGRGARPNLTTSALFLASLAPSRNGLGARLGWSGTGCCASPRTDQELAWGPLCRTASKVRLRLPWVLLAVWIGRAPRQAAGQRRAWTLAGEAQRSRKIRAAPRRSNQPRYTGPLPAPFVELRQGARSAALRQSSRRMT